MTLKSLAKKALAWQFLSISITASLNITFIVIMARMVSPAAFGIFALTSVIVGLVRTLAKFGVGQALIQRKEINEKHINITFFTAVGIGCLGCAFLYLTSDNISNLLGEKINSSHIQLLSLVLIISPFGIVSHSLLIRDLQFDKLFWCSTLSYLIGNLLIGLYLANKDFQEWAIIYAYLSLNVISMLLLLYFRPLKLSLSFGKTESKDILLYGGKLTTNIFLNQFALSLDKLMLGKLVSIGSLGIYERAQRLQNLPLTYTSKIVNKIMFSLMSKIADDLDKLSRFFLPTLAIVSFFTLYLATSIWFFSEQIVATLLGDKWMEAVDILKFLSIVLFLQTFTTFGDVFVRATKAFSQAFFVKIGFIIVLSLLLYTGFSLDGFKGAVIGIVVANIFHAILVLRLCCTVSKVKASFVSKLFIPVAIFGSILFLKNQIVLEYFGQWNLGSFATAIFLDILLAIVYLQYPIFLGKDTANLLFSIVEGAPLPRTIYAWMNRRFKTVGH